MTATALSIDTPVRPASATIDGSPMFWAGLIFGSMNIVQFAIRSGYAQTPGPVIGLMWMGALFTFIMAAFVLKIGSSAAFRAQPEVRAFRKQWGLLILGGGLLIGVVMGVLGYLKLYALMPVVPAPLALIVYAVGWRMAAVSSGRAGFNGLSVAALAAAAGLTVVAVYAGPAWQALAYALVLFILAAAPGLALILNSRN